MKNDSIHLRINAEFKKELEAQAEKQGRTLSNYLVHLINKTKENELHKKVFVDCDPITIDQNNYIISLQYNKTFTEYLASKNIVELSYLNDNYMDRVRTSWNYVKKYPRHYINSSSALEQELNNAYFFVLANNQLVAIKREYLLIINN